jgi:hypothetical protein
MSACKAEAATLRKEIAFSQTWLFGAKIWELEHTMGLIAHTATIKSVADQVIPVRYDQTLSRRALHSEILVSRLDSLTLYEDTQQSS